MPVLYPPLRRSLSLKPVLTTKEKKNCIMSRRHVKLKLKNDWKVPHLQKMELHADPIASPEIELYQQIRVNYNLILKLL
jgi:hypothetical protein